MKNKQKKQRGKTNNLDLKNRCLTSADNVRHVTKVLPLSFELDDICLLVIGGLNKRLNAKNKKPHKFYNRHYLFIEYLTVKEPYSLVC